MFTVLTKTCLIALLRNQEALLTTPSQLHLLPMLPIQMLRHCHTRSQVNSHTQQDWQIYILQAMIHLLQLFLDSSLRKSMTQTIYTHTLLHKFMSVAAFYTVFMIQSLPQLNLCILVASKTLLVQNSLFSQNTPRIMTAFRFPKP